LAMPIAIISIGITIGKIEKIVEGELCIS
jgi:hypothetical protein